MNLSGSYTFQANQEVVWSLLMNPDAIAKALPGVDQFVPVEGQPNTWRAQMKISVASISGLYGGTISMSDMNPPDQYRLTVNGEGQQSIIGGSAVIKLTYDEADEQTHLNWDADANISGRLARIGQRVIIAAATMMSNRFFGNLADQLPVAEQSEENQQDAPRQV